MTTLRYSTEGRTDGAAISTGAVAPDNAFNVANVGSGASVTATSTNARFGTRCIKFTTGGTSTTAYLQWTSSYPDGTNNWATIYVMFPSSPPATLRFCKWNRSAGNSAELALTTSRKLRILNISAATVGGDSTTVLTAGNWYRLEWATVNTGTGTSELKIFRWDESTALETITVSSANFSGPATEFSIGITNSTANYTFYTDEVAASSDGAIAAVSGSLNDPPTVSLPGTVATTTGHSVSTTATASDPQGGSLTYAWSFDSQPSGSTASVSSVTTSTASFTADKIGTYVLRSTVTKVSGGKTATATRTITVAAPVFLNSGGVSVETTFIENIAGSPTTVAPITNPPNWNLTFMETFDTPCAAGDFLDVYGDRWGAYPVDYLDTNGQLNSTGSHYNPDNLSVVGGQLRIHVGIGTDGKAQGAAPYPLTPNGSSIYNRTYGRREVRMKTDAVAGFKVAYLDWPADDDWNNGEIDFPEGGMNSTAYAFSHHVGNPTVQDAFNTGVALTGWHIYTVEWTSNLLIFFIDGTEVGRTTTAVPSTPMHFVLQTESNIGGYQPTSGDTGYVYVDYVAMWDA